MIVDIRCKYLLLTALPISLCKLSNAVVTRKKGGTEDTCFRIYPYLYLEDRRASMIMCTDLKTCRYNSTLTMLTSACDEILHQANSLARRTTIFKSGALCYEACS
jgi:hypothetical protein